MQSDTKIAVGALLAVPPGAWAVGVSGGADSVALLRLLASRQDLTLHVVHLNHETRGAESDGDAAFVRELAGRLGLECIIALRSEIERGSTDLPTNASARYRAARLELFHRVVADHRLRGVLLAHHADDFAETVVHRLIRGSGIAGLAAMKPVARIGGLEIRRPLLGVRAAELRNYLTSIGQNWREDSSNASEKYLRNRIRRFLLERPQCFEQLMALGTACAELRAWTARHAPRLESSFAIDILADLPDVLAEQSARRWLMDAGAHPGEIAPAMIQRLLTMARDAASPAVEQFAGGLRVRRRRRTIDVDRAESGC